MHRINGLGEVIWHRDLDQIGAAKLTRLVRRADGALLAVGWIPTPAQEASRLWLARFDDAGKVLWQRDHLMDLEPSGVSATPDGGLILLGTHQTAAKSQAFQLVKVGPGGGVWWQRLLAPAGVSAQAGSWDSVGITSAGGLLAVGQSVTGVQASQALMMRLDPWGHVSCTEAGTCGKQVGNPATKSCDDAKPCTIDRCDPKTGTCSHTPAGDGLACGDAKVCVASVCTAEPDGMVLVAKGSFYMGCNVAVETCDAYEQPVRKLAMASFWMQRGEATFGQLKGCSDLGKCAVPYKYTTDKHDLPISDISWLAAQAYCGFIGGRLPSEAEWAYAAKGSCAMIDGDCAKGMPVHYRPLTMSACSWAKSTPAWSYAYGCGNKVLHRAGQASGDRSPWGVLDLMGSMREYTHDYFDTETYKLDFTLFPFGKVNPVNPNNRVLRGGHFYAGTLDKEYRLARRHLANAGGHQYHGFRCVIPIPVKP